jgi:hypothetical protein
MAACVALALAASHAQPTGDAPTPGVMALAVQPGWADKRWDDGNAEVATYDATRILDGEARPHTLRLLTLREDLNREYMAKADWPHGQKPILTVLRQSQVATIPAPNFDHHTMATVFVERDQPSRLVKLIVSSQDWNGATFKEFVTADRTATMRYHSYWDGEGSGETTLRNHHEGGARFEEELPLLVRTLRLEEGLRVPLALYPNQTTTRAVVPEPVLAGLEVSVPLEPVEVPAGAWEPDALWLVTVQAQDGRLWRFWVTRESPQTLVQWGSADGREYRLRDVTRRQYWKAGG